MMEQAITENIAKTFRFDIRTGKTGDKYVVCLDCSKRMKFDYYGKPINERMIDHSIIHTAKAG